MRTFLAGALALLAAAGLRAEGLRVWGSFHTGALLSVPQNGETNVKLETDDGLGLTPARLRIDGGLDREAWGLRFRFMAGLDSDYHVALESSEQFAYAWGAFFSDRARLYAGRLDGGLWATPFDEAWSLDAITGLRVEIKPIDGLSFGCSFKIPPAGTDELGKYTFERMLNEAIVGARWDTPWFLLVGAFAFDGWDNYRRDEQEAVAGLVIKVVPNLWWGIESRFRNIMTGAMAFNLMEKAGYPFNPFIYGTIKVYEDGVQGEEDITVKINPELSLWLTGRLQPALELECGWHTARADETWYLGVKPKALYKFSGGMELSGYWMLTYMGGPKELNHSVSINAACYF
ncbi:MAG: hypothetical protein LBR16_09765 [Treponema sp.]|jgi:hypothetical protein|nr:hypothetical protein [Treponema sp.]